MEKNEKQKITRVLSTEDVLKSFKDLGEKYRLALDSYEKADRMLKALASFRVEIGLTQRELSELTNIKQPQLARYEKCQEYPRIDTFFRIADALKLNVYFEKKYVPLINFGSFQNSSIGISDTYKTYNLGAYSYGH